MRKDQIERMQEISEKLADVFLEEADPDQWPGNGKPIDKLSPAERGDRYWSKKNAAATLVVIMKTVNIVDTIQRNGKPPGENEGGDDTDKEIKAAEREAAKVLERIQSGAGKAEFTKRAHGKR